MKKITAVAIALLLAVCLMACGQPETPEAQSPSPDPTQGTEATPTPPAQTDEPTPEPTPEEDPYAFITESYTKSYKGTTEDGDTVYFAQNDDLSQCAVVVVGKDETRNASYIGEAFANDDSTYTVIDQYNGMPLTVIMEKKDDGLSLNIGIHGIVDVSSCDISELVAVVQTMDPVNQAVG